MKIHKRFQLHPWNEQHACISTHKGTNKQKMLKSGAPPSYLQPAQRSRCQRRLNTTILRRQQHPDRLKVQPLSFNVQLFKLSQLLRPQLEQALDLVATEVEALNQLLPECLRSGRRLLRGDYKVEWKYMFLTLSILQYRITNTWNFCRALCMLVNNVNAFLTFVQHLYLCVCCMSHPKYTLMSFLQWLPKTFTLSFVKLLQCVSKMCLWCRFTRLEIERVTTRWEMS